MTSVQGGQGFLYSEHLGRMFMESGITVTQVSASKIINFQPLAFAMVSVRPILDDEQDYFWQVTKVELCPDGDLNKFPSVRRVTAMKE